MIEVLAGAVRRTSLHGQHVAAAPVLCTTSPVICADGGPGQEAPANVEPPLLPIHTGPALPSSPHAVTEYVPARATELSAIATTTARRIPVARWAAVRRWLVMVSIGRLGHEFAPAAARRRRSGDTGIGACAAGGQQLAGLV